MMIKILWVLAATICCVQAQCQQNLGKWNARNFSIK